MLWRRVIYLSHNVIKVKNMENQNNFVDHRNYRVSRAVPMHMTQEMYVVNICNFIVDQAKSLMGTTDLLQMMSFNG